MDETMRQWIAEILEQHTQLLVIAVYYISRESAALADRPPRARSSAAITRSGRSSRMHGWPATRQASFLKRFSTHTVHLAGVRTMVAFGARGAHRLIGLAPSPSSSLPKMQIVGQPTAAAMCIGPAS